MRIVYDDTHQEELIRFFESFISGLDPKKYLRYSYGTDRVEMDLIYRDLNKLLSSYKMEIGNTVTHAHGIGNNCQYPVYYHADDNELQICGYLNLVHGMYGEGYASCEDFNNNLITESCEINKHGVYY